MCAAQKGVPHLVTVCRPTVYSLFPSTKPCRSETACVAKFDGHESPKKCEQAVEQFLPSQNQPNVMSVRIVFDNPRSCYTNLDTISGRVVASLPSNTSVSHISVKLEGESRTRLEGQKYMDRSEKRRMEIETHKLLYKVAVVFPEPNVVAASNAAGAQNAPHYTLAGGTYEYPFEFKIPFNNDCINNQNLQKSINIGSLLGDPSSRGQNLHVRHTLPPSIENFPGMADIVYYLKATVARPQFYKENLRFINDLRFMPIEPPRPADNGQETYARRQHQFSHPTVLSPKRSLFKKANFIQALRSGQPPHFSVDARLPNPPIITCNEPLPLRIIVKKLNDSPEILYLQSLHIELLGYTNIRAHDFTHTECESWVIVTKSNMKIPLGLSGSRSQSKQEWKIDPQLWNNIPLPNSVAPSFETCNISRTYQLDVRTGYSYGNEAGDLKPDLIFIPLRIDAKVFSGIAPPQELLDIMFGHPQTGIIPSEAETPAAPAPALPPRQPDASTQQQQNQHQAPPSPQESHPVTPAPVPAPSPAPAPAPIPNDDAPPSEAPPSYEDVMTETLGPITTPRREYNPHPGPLRPVPPPPSGSRSHGNGNDSGKGAGAGSGSGSASRSRSRSPASASASPSSSIRGGGLWQSQSPVPSTYSNANSVDLLTGDSHDTDHQRQHASQSGVASDSSIPIPPLRPGVPHRKPVPQKPSS